MILRLRENILSATCAFIYLLLKNKILDKQDCIKYYKIFAFIVELTTEC